jgi:hypothetical protein
MKYFLHDSSSFEDEKISELFIAFGYEGLGLFYTVLEKLAKQEKPIKTSVLKHQLKVGKRLEKCWQFMEEIEMICSNNGETFNKQLLNFSEKYKIKSEKNAKRILEWRENQSLTENVTRSESVRNTPKVKVSKVNKEDEEEENKLHANFITFYSAGMHLTFDGEFGHYAYKQTLKTKDQLKALVSEFLQEQSAVGKLTWQDVKDLRMHFIHWAKKQTVKSGAVYTGPSKKVINHNPERNVA